MSLNHTLFGEHAFRKSLSYPQPSTRSVINISLFEVCAVTMSEDYVDDSLDNERLRNTIIDLLKDEEFAHAITYSTNSTVAVQKRFDAMETAIIGVAF